MGSIVTRRVERSREEGVERVELPESGNANREKELGRRNNLKPTLMGDGRLGAKRGGKGRNGQIEWGKKEKVGSLYNGGRRRGYYSLSFHAGGWGGVTLRTIFALSPQQVQPHSF